MQNQYTNSSSSFSDCILSDYIVYCQNANTASVSAGGASADVSSAGGSSTLNHFCSPLFPEIIQSSSSGVGYNLLPSNFPTRAVDDTCNSEVGSNGLLLDTIVSQSGDQYYSQEQYIADNIEFSPLMNADPTMDTLPPVNTPHSTEDDSLFSAQNYYESGTEEPLLLQQPCLWNQQQKQVQYKNYNNGQIIGPSPNFVSPSSLSLISNHSSVQTAYPFNIPINSNNSNHCGGDINATSSTSSSRFFSKSGSSGDTPLTSLGSSGPSSSRQANVYCCPECPQQLSRLYDLKRHYKTAHVRERIPCKDCPKSFNRKDNLDRHMKNSHGNSG